ncbi:MAG: DUF1573 domain-containing protein [Proteobacteria bacterium]|nr:DUF1573 domain-containing protein [Pseudomonadota bacterium]
MKMACFIWTLLITPIVLCLTVYADQSSELPVAVAKQPHFEFGTVVEGTVVTHDFIIGNQGKVPLSIKDVKTSCGCTTANYTKTIEPGTEGKITIKGNTRGYGDRQFSKTITVFTNDPRQEQMNLYISGNVESFALVEPEGVFLTGIAGDTIQSIITITPLKKYPFNITESSAAPDIEKKISFTLNKKEDRYILSINNLLNEQGRYRGSIILKTDNSTKPEIIINVSGTIKGKR